MQELVKEIVGGYKGKIVFDSSKPEGTSRKFPDVSRLEVDKIIIFEGYHGRKQ